MNSEGTSVLLIMISLDQTNITFIALGHCERRGGALFFIARDTCREIPIDSRDEERNCYTPMQVRDAISPAPLMRHLESMLDDAELCICTLVSSARDAPSEMTAIPTPFHSLIVRDGFEIILTWQQDSDDLEDLPEYSAPHTQLLLRGLFTARIRPDVSVDAAELTLQRLNRLPHQRTPLEMRIHERDVNGIRLQVMLSPFATSEQRGTVAAVLLSDASVAEVHYDEVSEWPP